MSSLSLYSTTSSMSMLTGGRTRNRFPLVGIYKETKNRSNKKVTQAYLKKQRASMPDSGRQTPQPITIKSPSPTKTIYAAIAALNLSSDDGYCASENGTVRSSIVSAVPTPNHHRMRVCRVATADLHTVAEAYWNFRLQEAPEFATVCSIHDYDDRVSSVSFAAIERRVKRCTEFLSKLSTIDHRRLAPEDRLNWRLMRADLDAYVSGWRWRYHSAANAVNFMENIPVDFGSFLIDAMRFETEADYATYVARLRAIAVQVDEEIELMMEAIKHGTTQHECSIRSALHNFDELLKGSAEDSPFYAPYTERLDRLTALPIETRQRIMTEGRATIESTVFPAFVKLREFLQTEYLPNTRQTYGVGSLKDGQEFYAACLRWHLTINIDPKEVHEIGLQEVARIQNEMKAVMRKAGFEGRLSHFMSLLKSDSRFYHRNDEDLLEEFRHIMRDIIAPRLPDFFTDVPSCPVEVVASSCQGAQYISASADGSRPGQFQVNLMKPESFARFSMMALTLHETMPGHHLQYAYAATRCLPTFRKFRDYRRIFGAPILFPVYTAYDEGWALYAEYLGEEMGVYRDAYEMFGRLSDEMLRAVRLVVDTGLHLFNWSHDEATAYMNDNTCLSPEDIDEEVNRYLTWPGQACAYKIGELKIKQLRHDAETRLGERFDVKRFHDVVLSLGAIPLCVLETEVNDWIDEMLRSPAESSDEDEG